MAPGGRWFVALVVVLGSLGVLASCGFSTVDCGVPPAHEPEFAGTLVGIDRAEATFRIDRVIDQGDPPVLPAFEEGREVPVHYLDNDEQFLEVGSTYRVRASVESITILDVSGPGRSTSNLTSQVDTPSCVAGTVHADGAAIDSGLLARPWIRQYGWWTAGVVAAVLLLVVGGASVSGYIDRREEGAYRDDPA